MRQHNRPLVWCVSLFSDLLCHSFILGSCSVCTNLLQPVQRDDANLRIQLAVLYQLPQLI